MTAYFDDLRREVRELPKGDAWLDGLKLIEQRVSKEVLLVTGDREFPNDIRETILDTINMKAVYDISPNCPATKSAVQYALRTKVSGLLEALHSIFHNVARRRIKTRFGLLSGSSASTPAPAAPPRPGLPIDSIRRDTGRRITKAPSDGSRLQPSKPRHKLSLVGNALTIL